MTPQERELIEGLFQRLKAADMPNKDREAEDLINRRTVELPATPYLLVQTALVQEHALNAAQQRIAQLEKELEAHKPQAPAASGASTSFLGGLLGGRWNQGGAAPSAPAGAPPRSSVPITGPSPASAAQAAAPYAAAAPGGGGFLHSALTTAAGVAGGALLYDGLSSLLFHRPGPFAPYVGAGWGGGAGSPWGSGGNLYETNVVNYYGDSRQPGQNAPDQNAIDASDNDPGYGNDPNIRDASYDPSADSGNYDDGSGGDFGGGDFGGSDDQSV